MYYYASPPVGCCSSGVVVSSTNASDSMYVPVQSSDVVYNILLVISYS